MRRRLTWHQRKNTWILSWNSYQKIRCVKSEHAETQRQGGVLMDARRGYVPEDEKNFSPEALQVMRTASRHIRYLINEGYDLKPASTFVGNHFLLSER